MRVLFVVSDLSFPPQEGLHEQLVQLMFGLNERGHDVHLCGFIRRTNLEGVRRLGDFIHCHRLVGYAGSSLKLGIALKLGARRRELGQLVAEAQWVEADIVHLDGAAAAALSGRISFAPRLMSWVDPGSRRFARFARSSTGFCTKIKFFITAVSYYLLEATTVSSSVAWHVVSPIDAEYLKRAHLGRVNVRSIPVMVGKESYSLAWKSIAPIRRIVIFADLRLAHMLSSVDRLLDALVNDSELDADVRISILGRISGSPHVRGFANPSIEYVPWVEDLAAYLQSSCLVVLPDELGTGLKNRAVSALSAGACVVGTTVAFEGLQVVDGVHALICDTRGLPYAVMSLMASGEERVRLGKNAPLAVADLAQKSVLKQWETFYYGLIAQTGGDM